jgi:hypothetical protein
MCNSQSDIDKDKQPAGGQHVDDEAEPPTNGYYYDDSTGYEVYQDEDEDKED